MIISFIIALFSLPSNIIYWIRWIIARIVIHLYNIYRPMRFQLYDDAAKGDPVKLNFLVPLFEKEVESPFPESHLQEFADEVTFYGVNSKSECLLVRIARGANHEAEAWIYLKLSNGKTYHLSETSGYQLPFEEKCTVFSCGNLQMHYLSPMRRWRIFFCGMLREDDQNKKNASELVFVKFLFLWRASSDVYDLTLHTNPKGFADAFARTNWKTPLIPPISEFTEALNFYAQSGNVGGTVSVNDGDEYEMFLFGEKMRSLGKGEQVAGAKFKVLLGCTPENGLTFHIAKATAPHIFHNLPFGFIVTPSEVLETVTETDISLKPFGVAKDRKHIKASFTTSSKYDVIGSTAHEPHLFYSGQGWSGYLELTFAEFKIQNKKGYGFILEGEVYNAPKKRRSKPIHHLSFPESVPLTLPFTNEASDFEAISGGKGSSLGKLTQLSNIEKSFTVPKGIVVTTSAYKEFLTAELRNTIQLLEDVAYGNSKGNLKNFCQKVSDTVVNTQLPNNVCHSITENLKIVFGEQMYKYRFAVRSSATGEDTASMSAAGQMETFLGIQGIQEILHAVKKCWASQFSHIAVEYKRRNGQILNSSMAVVIQEMVACEISGVLFTCDPVTNNPSVITISANYGLGETVVSGSVEPDTIKLRRNEQNEVEFDSVIIGSKHQRMVMEDSGGTSTEDLPEDSKSACCLSQENAVRLGSIAIKIEQYYRSSRDIEWGIVKDHIYILQSRPVTNIATETEYELKHEFDSPMRSENEYSTMANVGEVVPGAQSPLGFELFFKRWAHTIRLDSIEKGLADNMLECRYFFSGLLVYYSHIMICVIKIMTRYGNAESSRSKGFQISIFGRQLEDPEILEFAKEKCSEEFQQSLWHRLIYYKDLFFYDFGLEKIKERLDNYHLNFLKTKTAQDTFTALMDSCSDFEEFHTLHMACTTNSSEWNLYMFEVLSKAKGGDLDNDVYSDFAGLLATSSNVESANVPESLQKLADQIGKEMSSDKFKRMSVEEAEKWLQTTNSLSGQKFREFLKRHGHRCLNEFNIFSITWSMDPKLLVGLLKNLVGVTKPQHENSPNDDEILFSKLNTPLSFYSRLMLKFILPNCRRAVRGREAAKSLVVKSFDYHRRGFRHLAKLMVSEGRIPEEDLLFFMTIDEIDELLKTRSPGIISRSKNRQKLFPIVDKYQFPEIMKGLPIPINEEHESGDSYEFVADLTMTGIPVSQGVTKGYARVAITLEEAAHLKAGEILITYSTDIGWSPYFPIISGVVTELGGLISHGAVVSREYGLPCVVGLQGATKRFQTGDYVLLDGKKGILQRLPKPTQ